MVGHYHVGQDTQTELDALCDLQPIKFPEQWHYVVRSPQLSDTNARISATKASRNSERCTLRICLRAAKHDLTVALTCAVMDMSP